MRPAPSPASMPRCAGLGSTLMSDFEASQSADAVATLAETPSPNGPKSGHQGATTDLFNVSGPGSRVEAPVCEPMCESLPAPEAPGAAPSDESPAVGRNEKTGQFAPGNQLSRRSGVRAFELRGATSLPPDLRAALDRFRAGVEADQGGRQELSTIGAGYVDLLAEVNAIIGLLLADLAERGIFTTRGRVRSTYQQFLLAIDRYDRLAQRIGLERKTRDVSLASYLAARRTEDSTS